MRGVIAVITAMVLCTACVTPHGTVVTDVDPLGWQSAGRFSLANQDTIILRDLQVVVRWNDDFTHEPLPLTITLTTPTGIRFSEPFMLRIPRAQHRIAALRHQTILPYRRQVQFTEVGDYLFTITPDQPVRGIEIIGIHTQSSK